MPGIWWCKWTSAKSNAHISLTLAHCHGNHPNSNIIYVEMRVLNDFLVLVKHKLVSPFLNARATRDADCCLCCDRLQHRSYPLHTHSLQPRHIHITVMWHVFDLTWSRSTKSCGLQLCVQRPLGFLWILIPHIIYRFSLTVVMLRELRSGSKRKFSLRHSWPQLVFVLFFRNRSHFHGYQTLTSNHFCLMFF